jgi:hypothetical protein
LVAPFLTPWLKNVGIADLFYPIWEEKGNMKEERREKEEVGCDFNCR